MRKNGFMCYEITAFRLLVAAFGADIAFDVLQCGAAGAGCAFGELLRNGEEADVPALQCLALRARIAHLRGGDYRHLNGEDPVRQLGENLLSVFHAVELRGNARNEGRRYGHYLDYGKWDRQPMEELRAALEEALQRWGKDYGVTNALYELKHDEEEWRAVEESVARRRAENEAREREGHESAGVTVKDEEPKDPPPAGCDGTA